MVQVDIVAQIKNSVDIVTLIQNYVPLTKSGNRYRGSCPFHNEKTPSFFVFPGKGNYYCFGCKATGDVIDFLKNYKRLSFVESLELLAGMSGLQHLIEGSKKQQNENWEKQKKLYQIMEKALMYYNDCLNNKNLGTRALSFINKRGLSGEVIDKFQLGFAPPGWDNLKNKLKSYGFKEEEIYSCGLLNKSDKRADDHYYNTFRNRIIFPIFNKKNRVIAFGGRILETENNEPKYLNSRNTDIYTKGNTLFGFNLSFKHIREKDYLFVVEGYMDQISLCQFGIKNVVACLGTALTFEAVSQIKSQTSNVYLMFDGDEAGLRAVEKSVLPILQSEINGFVILLPDGMDPDEFVRKNGAEALEELRKHSMPIFTFILQNYLSVNGLTREGKTKSIKSLMSIIREIKSPITKQFLVEEINDAFSIDIGALSKELPPNIKNRNISTNKTIDNRKSINIKSKKNNPIELSKFHSFLGLFFLLSKPITKYPEYGEYNLDKIWDDCPYPELIELLNLIKSNAQKGIEASKIPEDELIFYGFSKEFVSRLIGNKKNLYNQDCEVIIKQMRAISVQLDLERIKKQKRNVITFFKDLDRGLVQFLTDEHKLLEQHKKQEELRALTIEELASQKKMEDIRRVIPNN